MKKILEFYQYAFYKLYKFYDSSTYSKWWSEWKAGGTIIVLEMWFFSTIKVYYHYLFNIPLENNDSKVDLSTIIYGFLFLGINWYLFEHQDKWKLIVDKFDKLPKKTNNIAGIIAWIVLISIVIAYWYSVFNILPKLTYV